MKVPILGLIENMSYANCPHCRERIELFGRSKGKEASDAANIDFLGSMAVDPTISQLCDEGRIEEYDGKEFASIAQRVIDKTRQVKVVQELRHPDSPLETESRR